jgi:ubiquitin carboxyl-terminal hydrolase 7
MMKSPWHAVLTQCLVPVACVQLQYSSSAVSTKDLTNSFGWTSYDTFMQHDIHELNRVLCEKLEEKMKVGATD